jgi:hypothetical protein
MLILVLSCIGDSAVVCVWLPLAGGLIPYGPVVIPVLKNFSDDLVGELRVTFQFFSEGREWYGDSTPS